MPSIPQPHEPDDCEEYEKRVACMGVGEVISELLYISYATQRDLNPDISPERWAKIYVRADLLEAKYQAEKALQKASL